MRFCPVSPTYGPPGRATGDCEPQFWQAATCPTTVSAKVKINRTANGNVTNNKMRTGVTAEVNISLDPYRRFQASRSQDLGGRDEGYPYFLRTRPTIYLRYVRVNTN